MKEIQIKRLIRKVQDAHDFGTDEEFQKYKTIVEANFPSLNEFYIKWGHLL